MASTPRPRVQATFAFAGAVVLGWRVGGRSGIAIAALGGVLLLLAWLAPAAYAPIHRGLDAVVRVFLAAFTWLVLGLVYFGVFAPLHTWRSLRRRDPLRRRRDPAASTYLEPLPPAENGRFRRQF